MTSSYQSLVPGFKQVEEFGPDEEYEDEEETTYVTVDLGAVEPTLLPSSAEYRLIGLDTPTPFLQLSGTIFKGYHDTLLGTELLFSEDKDATGRPLRHIASSEQRVRFKEVQLERKGSSEDAELPSTKGKRKGKEKEQASSSSFPSYLSQIDSSELLDRMTGSAPEAVEGVEDDGDNEDGPRKSRRRGRRKSSSSKGKGKGKEKAADSDYDPDSGHCDGMAVQPPAILKLYSNPALLIASALSIHGLRKRSLSPSGAVAAFVVGWLMMNVKVYVVGVSLIVFYLTGSKATKYGKSKKRLLEDGYEEAGYRTGWQVLCNSIWALLASIAWTVAFVPDAYVTVVSKLLGNGLSRTLLMAVLGHFACCLGDTLASELGILSHSQPILITTLKPVPPGTNGGISLGGTLASIIGGIIIGLTFSVSLILQNSHCATNASSLVTSTVIWGAIAGGGGSMVDSFLGATIQETVYSEEKKRITEHGGGGKAINGLNLLTNNQVNLLSSFLTALYTAYYA
ncbi:hypothetical protein ONZ45_g16783 [Pleurotus djamor]|nr:hypothetical protein ONZ45_g16783 [Pleurotus djamor]